MGILIAVFSSVFATGAADLDDAILLDCRQSLFAAPSGSRMLPHKLP
jgi:hypothetical protein